MIDQNLEARSRRALELTTDSPTSTTSNTSTTVTTFTAADAATQPIVLERVHFTYASRPQVPVLQDVSAVIAPKSFTCFAGKSGAGKSTLVSVLSGLVFPQQGRVRVGTHVLLEGTSSGVNNCAGAKWLHANVGVVQQQDKSLMSGTIRENIEYGKVRLFERDVVYAAAIMVTGVCD